MLSFAAVALAVGLIGTVALLAFLAKPLYTAWRSNTTPDHETENVYRVDSTSEAVEPFPSLFADSSRTVTLVVPAYNEQERLPAMMDEMLAHLKGMESTIRGFSWEIIIVDDGSRDRTVDVALRYVDSEGSDRVRLLKLAQNHGKGGAVRKGMLRGRGQYLLMVDADGATEAAELSNLLRQLESTATHTGFGVAIGSRAHLEDESKAQRKALRTFLMHAFHAFVSILVGGHGIKDTQCGFKLFTRRSARVLFSTLHIERWAFDVELVMIAHQLGFPMVEVPVRWSEIDGSKLDVVSASIEMARDIVLIRACYMLGLWKINMAALREASTSGHRVGSI
jgi:dolichyl-phosphate beta-glucosyltransferase